MEGRGAEAAAGSAGGGADPELAPVFQQLQQVAARLSNLTFASMDAKQQGRRQEQSVRLMAEEERLQAELAAQGAAYRRAKKEVGLQDLQVVLPPDVALVDVFLYGYYAFPKARGSRLPPGHRLAAFVIRKQQLVGPIDLGPAEKLTSLAETWRLSFGMSASAAKAAQGLREMVWEPLEKHLQGAKVVLVSPDGVLGRIPLAALPGRQPGTYLLEDWPIALVPMPQALPELVGQPQKATRPRISS